jgi:hypothetical protein
MTLLTCCQDAAIELSLEQPGVIIGNTDINVQRLLRAAQRTGKELVTRAAWSVLRVQQPFTAAAGEDQPGIIPADFARLIPETFWDLTNKRLINGGVTPARWQSLRASAVSGTWPRWFILRGTTVTIYPGMSGGESMVFEYVSSHFCASAAGATQATWQADTDVGRLNEELITLGIIAYYRLITGLPNLDQMNEFEDRLVQEVDNDNPRSGVLAAGDIFAGSRAWDGQPAPDGGSGWAY